MFQKRTVIITGAGASWHYGYPTGEALVQKVVEKAKIASQFFRATAEAKNPMVWAIAPQYFSRFDTLEGSPVDLRSKWITAANECDEIAARLFEVRPLVIDYFLGQNESLRDIGKLLIAWVIRECAAQKQNINRRQRAGERVQVAQDDWYRFIVHKLVSGCSNGRALHSNKITFVTFNYDISLEWYITRALNSIEMFADQVDAFFERKPVLHVYGRVTQHIDDTPQSFNLFPAQITGRDQIALQTSYDTVKRLFDRAYESAQLIRTIGPHEKDDSGDEIRHACEAIAQAECVYILGYGFDENNSARLNLAKSLRPTGGSSKRVVLFTNYGDRNVVNKKASQLLLGTSNQFLAPGEAIKSDYRNYYYEKSTRDVYGALADDFDSVEEEWGYPIPPY
jgi:hypothetical protein